MLGLLLDEETAEAPLSKHAVAAATALGLEGQLLDQIRELERDINSGDGDDSPQTPSVARAYSASSESSSFHFGHTTRSEKNGPRVPEVASLPDEVFAEGVRDGADQTATELGMADVERRESDAEWLEMSSLAVTENAAASECE